MVENIKEAEEWCVKNQANLEWIPWGEIGEYRWVCYLWISEIDDEITGEGTTPQEAVNDFIKKDAE